MELRRLTRDDLDDLFRFEVENRQWFERHIEARPPAFYCRSVVREHIEALLAQSGGGAAYPGIIEQAGEILGRINLIKVDPSTARLGYRVAARHAGKGVASFGLSALLALPCLANKLNKLRAFVSLENTASHKLLRKHGFRPIAQHKQHSQVGGRLLDCIEYEHQLSRF